MTANPADDRQDDMNPTSASASPPNDAAGPGNAAARNTASAAAPPDERLQATEAERDDYRDRFLRAQADLENYRKRSQREREEERRNAPLPLARDLLPALDNLRRALDVAKTSGRIEDLTQGVDLVLKQIEDTLERHGLKAIAGVGLPFDPHLHEALTQVPSAEHPPLTVLQELERGYTLHDRVVRPSKVIVSKESS